MKIDNPESVRSVYLGDCWVMVQESSFTISTDDSGEQMFSFIEGRTGYRDHRALVQGPLSSIVGIRSQA